MQASDRILAQRYAKAFFEIGAGREEKEHLHKDLSEAMKLLRDKMDVFRHPMLGAAKQKTMLKNLVASKVSARTLKFLELLIEKKRFFLLPLIVMNYGTMQDAFSGIMRAQVRSASKLTKADETRLKGDLKKTIFDKDVKDVEVEVKESPELLGGMVVRIGDWVLDGSLQGKLRRLAAQLIEES